MIYARAYVYSTSDPTYSNKTGEHIQSTDQWLSLTLLLYKLGITILY